MDIEKQLMAEKEKIRELSQQKKMYKHELKGIGKDMQWKAKMHGEEY